MYLGKKTINYTLSKNYFDYSDHFGISKGIIFVIKKYKLIRE